VLRRATTLLVTATAIICAALEIAFAITQDTTQVVAIATVFAASGVIVLATARDEPIAPTILSRLWRRCRRLCVAWMVTRATTLLETATAIVCAALEIAGAVLATTATAAILAARAVIACAASLSDPLASTIPCDQRPHPGDTFHLGLEQSNLIVHCTIGPISAARVNSSPNTPHTNRNRDKARACHRQYGPRQIRPLTSVRTKILQT